MSTLSKTSTLKDALGAGGLTLRRCYYAQLKHGLMGFFPWETGSSEEKEMFVVRDVENAREILRTMEPRSFKLGSALVICDDATGWGVCVDEEAEDGRKTILVLDAAQISKILRASTGTKPFTWAVGLFGADAEEEEYLETIGQLKA